MDELEIFGLGYGRGFKMFPGIVDLQCQSNQKETLYPTANSLNARAMSLVFSKEVFPLHRSVGFVLWIPLLPVLGPNVKQVFVVANPRFGYNMCLVA